MTLDPSTGLLSWTPGLSNVGTSISVEIVATNSIGTQYVTFNFPVYFTDQTANVNATVSGHNATVTWTAPARNASQITGYLIDLSWTINGVTYLGVFNSTGTGTSDTLSIPVLGSIQYHVTVTAYDAAGDLGVPDSQRFTFTGP
jgi:hypothetical protein